METLAACDLHLNVSVSCMYVCAYVSSAGCRSYFVLGVHEYTYDSIITAMSFASTLCMYVCVCAWRNSIVQICMYSQPFPPALAHDSML